MVGEYLKSRGCSHQILVDLRKNPGTLQINGQSVRTIERVKADDIVSITLEDEESNENIVPSDIPLDIVYEDDDLMVINKPKNMPVHPSQGHYTGTLANAVAALYEKRGESFVFRAVNRLDRDTTGLLVLAKNRLSGGILSDYVSKKIIHREYLALCCGRVDSAGTVSFPIGRKEGSTIERIVDPANGESAVTHYELISYDSDRDLSLVKLVLETGRTHQIRVHMKAIGHPLPGDFLYNPDYRYIDRQALHSWKLRFPHPITGVMMEFEAEMPKDFSWRISHTT